MTDEQTGHLVSSASSASSDVCPFLSFFVLLQDVSVYPAFLNRFVSTTSLQDLASAEPHIILFFNLDQILSGLTSIDNLVHISIKS